MWVRFVRHLVVTLMALGFYVTPVFYGRSIVQVQYRWVQSLNPMTYILEAHRAVLIEGDLPELWFYVVAVLAVGLITVGTVVYNHLSGTFVDEL